MDQNNIENNSSADQDQTEYEVGYKKPPEHTRFKPGKSGNPKGRSKGAKGLSTVFMEEASERVTIKMGDRSIKVTKLQAIMKRLFQKAMEGNAQAMSKIAEIARMIEPQQTQQQAQKVLSLDDQAIIAAYIQRQHKNEPSNG
jgi:hypothetical protein